MHLTIIPSAVEKKESEKTYLIPAVLFNCVKDSEFNMLVDLIVGHIILDPQKDKRVEIPDMNKFSANELKVLQAAVELGTFYKSELDAASGLDPVMTQHYFSFLIKRGFFTFNDGKYTANESFNIIFSPDKLCFDGEVVSLDVNYDVKLEPRIQPQDLKNQLSKYVNIRDFKECWIVFHRHEK